METFVSGGVTLAYLDRGDGPPVVLLHNGGTSSTIWRHQVDALCAEHRTVAVDLPGFGCSPHPDAPIDLDDMVGLVGGLLDHLGVRDAVVVGNCMGSNIAVLLAESRPELVSGMVLVNILTEATFSHGWLGPVHRVAELAPGPSTVARRIARRMVPPGPLAKATVRFQLGSKGVARRLHHDPELVALARRRDQLPALVDVLDDMASYGALDRLGRVDVPTTVVWGAANRVLSPTVGAELDRRLGAEQSVVLEGCGHLPMMEDPDAVTALIEQRCRAGAEAAASDRGAP